jgi:3',5'-nucleoside bisphosphate phosphatase
MFNFGMKSKSDNPVPAKSGLPFNRLEPHLINADLHSHSCMSDGALEPRELALRAAQNGVQLWALTDHDEVVGIAEARAAANEVGMPFLGGVEVSVTWAGETVHIVGVGIDEKNPALVAGLRRTRDGRDSRAVEMGKGLARAGIQDAYEGALCYVRNPGLVSRTHFARWLVNTGHCSSINEVFQRFLVEGKPGFVAHRWASLSEAIQWIKGAGGIAVMAHPGRYRFSPSVLELLIEEFKQCGGEGIEVICGSHTKDQYVRFGEVAKRFDLMASRGSDFHAPDESHTELGRLPLLPDWLVPVWHRLI